MDRSQCGQELLADIGTLFKDLEEMHVRAVTASTQRNDECDEAQASGMVIRGR